MKKFLSLVLALVMTMSLVTVAGAYTDESSINYDEAVDVISALEIVGGYADGSFNPKGTLTRGAAAKIICNILVGPETAAELIAAEAPYSDVAADHTFAGYIAYCAEKGIISGYADGTFKPANTLTGYAFLKMLLGTLGYDATIEGYTGSNWAINVAEAAIDAELTKGLEGKFNGNKALTREEACLYAFNTLKAQTVGYSDKGSSVVIGDIEITTGASDAYLKWDDASTGDKTLLWETKFADVLRVGAAAADDLGRPAHEWELKGEKKWESIGVYADEATFIVENYIKAKDLAEELKDADLALATGVTVTPANGTIIEMFDTNENDKFEASEIVYIAATLAQVTGTSADLASKDGDNRTITISGFNKLIADKDSETAPTAYVVPDNFDELYKELEGTKAADEVYVLVIANASNAAKAFSVEIPEIVKAKITKANADKTEIVADGETYLVAPGAVASVALGKAELTVGANGVVYAIDGVSSEKSEVIYLDTYTVDSDKWGNNDVVNAQIVTEAGEVKEVVLAAKDKNDVAITYTASMIGGYYTYETNDDGEYILSAETLNTVSANIDDEDLKIGTHYFADDVTFVYVEGTGTKLEVSVKEGVQKVTLDAETSASYIYDADDEEITVVFVKGEYEAGAVEGEELVFVADAAAAGLDTNKEDKSEETYTFYIEGVEYTEMVEGTVATGFFSYAINEKTGEYEFKAPESTTAKKQAVGTDVTITKDKYIGFGTTLVDAVLSADAEIYDLTENGLNTLAAIADWDADETALQISFVYDAKDNVVTCIYVEEVPSV